MQDQILLALYALAKVKVEELVPGCYREEVVHELAAVWLERLRAGGWNLPREDWEAFVVGEIRNRRVEDYRGRKRTLGRDASHLRIITDAPRAWMSQELLLEEERLRDFTDTVRATLPAKCVRAHALIRDEQLTYAQVAKKLRVPVRRVHEYVKTVHRTFRAALPSVAIEAPKSQHGGRSKATADVNLLTHGDRRSTTDVNLAANDACASIADPSGLTSGDFESTTDTNTSTRRDGWSTIDVNASPRADLDSTPDVNAQLRGGCTSTGAARVSPRGGFAPIADVNASARDDFESTRGVNASAPGELESTRRDRESPPDVLSSTRGANEGTTNANTSTPDADALIGGVCLAPAPSSEATSSESETPSTSPDGPRAVRDAMGNALWLTSVV
jgi:DNA-directed RNA polymerase specialized sigma24 family protein